MLDLARIERDPSYAREALAERELELGVFGPFAQQRALRRIPAQAKHDLEKLKQFPNIYGMPGQTFSGIAAQEFAPANLRAAINTTTTETNLWDPALFAPIPALDMRPGKIYEVMFGGTMGTTATPTIIFRARCGTNNSAPPTGTDLGASATVTLGTISAQPFYGEFTMGVRSVGVAASGATVTGTGFVLCPAAAAATVTPHVLFGGAVPTTVDHTVAQGIGVSVTWGASSASNTLTPFFVIFRSLN